MTTSPSLIVGSSGQVGAVLANRLRARGGKVLLTSSKPGRHDALPLDLANPSSIRDCFRIVQKELGSQKAEVFLTGALTHVDRCEAERDLCWRMNAEGPGRVAEECDRLGYNLTHFSTEYVYGEAEYEGGAIGPFSETDPPAPTSWYGESKLEAERRVQKILPEALIVRTTMVFSWDPQGFNFLMQYFRHLTDLTEGRSPAPFRIPKDQISTPTYAPALAEAVIRLREQGVGGIINLVGSDLLSRQELLERVIAAFGFDREKCLPGFQFLKTAELGQSARRPLSAGLAMNRANSLGVKVGSLLEAFEDVRRLRARLG